MIQWCCFVLIQDHSEAQDSQEFHIALVISLLRSVREGSSSFPLDYMYMPPTWTAVCSAGAWAKDFARALPLSCSSSSSLYGFRLFHWRLLILSSSHTACIWCVSADVSVPCCACKGHRTTLWSWILEVELKLSDFLGKYFTY